MNFSQRSYTSELLDRDDIPFEDIRRNMQELDFINTWLGGHKITIDGLMGILESNGLLYHKKKILICEIGCGGGDNLLAIHRWCKKNNIQTAYIGIDINPDCIRVAQAKLASMDVCLVASDYATTPMDNFKPDIIFSSLFCHHFGDGALVKMLQWMRKHANVGFFINDLHRHPLAYYSIKVLTALFSRSYLVKNDAPLSVQRGFKASEWKGLLKKAGVTGYLIEWKWAFRHLVTVNHVFVEPFNTPEA